MRHSQKAKTILCVCMLLVGVFSAISLYKAFRPSAGLPFEQLTIEQAQSYMEYEEGYVLADIRQQTAYDESHIAGAISIPYENLVEKALSVLPDKTQMIYVYSDSDKESEKACRKLSELGYTNVAQIIRFNSWYTSMDTERNAAQ